MTVSTDSWVSVASADLLLSLRAPRGWEVAAPDENRLVLYRDDADEGGYRASVSMLHGAPEQPGLDWFRAFCLAAPERLAESMPDFEPLRTDEFRLSSRARVFLVEFRQHAAGAPATSQLQAYVWVDSYRMYLVNAATLRAHEDRDLPVFDRIVRELRVLPERR